MNFTDYTMTQQSNKVKEKQFTFICRLYIQLNSFKYRNLDNEIVWNSHITISISV